jgi:heme-degrading monooxygenase HmoA
MGEDRTPPPHQQAGTEFIALSRFAVANGMADQVKEAFMHRPHLVDDAPGFLRMQVSAHRLRA